MVIIILFLQLITSINSLKFGVHYPNGIQALSYIYSSDGFWKPLNNLNYLWNKYSAATNHEINLVELNKVINKGQFVTCKDSEGHLLGDISPMDGELDLNIQDGYAFHTHNAKTGSNTNHPTTKPEYTFFYNENYLGRFIANLYGTDIPFGLGIYTDAIQWSILTGKNTLNTYTGIASPTTASEYALRGIYYLDQNNNAFAVTTYNNLITYLSPVYDATLAVMEYSYSNLTKNVDLALTLMFVQLIYYANRDTTVLQHLISIRSILLSRQQNSVTVYSASVVGTGWLNENSVISFKETALAILALGAGADATFEAGKYPIMFHTSPFLSYIRNHVRKTGNPVNYTSYGPYYTTFPLGIINVDFYLRCFNPTAGALCQVDVKTQTALTPVTSCSGTNWFLFSLNGVLINGGSVSGMEIRIENKSTNMVDYDAAVIKINYTARATTCPAGQKLIFQIDKYDSSASFSRPNMYSNQCVSDGYPSQFISNDGITSLSSCPTTSAKIGNRCITCSAGKFFDSTTNLDSSGGFKSVDYIGNYPGVWPCISSCVSPKKILNKMCVTSCPNGYADISNNCTKCGDGQFSNGISCVATCPNYTYQNTCFTTCPTFTYMKVGTYECLYFCYDTITIDSSVTTFKVPIVETNVFNLCPGDDIICTKFNMVKKQLTPKNLCITCEISSPSQPYFDEVSNTCVAITSCPTGSANSVTNKACIKCTNISSYMTLTHTNRIVIDFNHCFYCETTNKYMLNLDGVCLSTCPSNYLFDSEKNCYCNQYLDGNNCVSQCPGNLGANTITKMCVNCKNETTLSINYNHICTAPSNMPTTTVIIDTNYNVAVDCITAIKNVYNSGCVDICPNLTTIYSGGNECFAWKPIGKFMNNNLIENYCPSNYFSDSDNICKDCNILTDVEKKSTTCVLIVVISTSAPTPAPITPTPSPTPAQTPASILSPTPAPRAPLTCSEQNKKDFYGNCVDICPVNSKLNNDGMKCECPNEYSLPNIDNSDCEMFLTAEYDHLSKLNILQISQNQIIHFEDLAMEQVRLMRNNTIPLNENYLDSLDFALVLEV